MKATRRLAVFVGAMMFSAAAFGYVSNSWKADSSGNWNGKYSDVSHWSLGHLPDLNANGGGNRGEDAVFPNQDFDYTVEIDVTLGDGDIPLPQFVKISENSLTAGGGTVRFVGSGMLKCYQNRLFLYEGGKAVFADEAKVAYGSVNLYSGASLAFEDNAVGGDESSGKINFQTGELGGATLAIRGGTVHGSIQCTTADGRFEMSGGALNMNKTACPAFADGFVFNWTGGVISTRDSIYDLRFLPACSEATFVQNHRNSAPYGFSIVSDELKEQEFNGTAYLTNAVAGNITALDLQAPVAIYGHGTLTAVWLKPYYAGLQVLDFNRLNIGDKIYCTSSAEVEFPGDMTLGGFGDWTWYSFPKALRVYGTVTVDTTDSLDGVTPRPVPLHDVLSQFGMGVKTVGGGTASLWFAYTAEASRCFREFDFRAAQTVIGKDSQYGTSNADTGLRCAKFTLGAGRKFTIFPAKASIDAAEADVASDAEIIVDLTGLKASDTTDMTGGLLAWPLLTVDKGDAVPLSRFTLVNNPGSWELKKTGNCVWLRDATEKRALPETVNVWTGAKDGNWADGGNWTLGAAPSAASDIAYFDVCDGVTEVAVPDAGITIDSIRGAGLINGGWYRSCGPMSFSGGPITFSNVGGGGTSCAIYNCGMTPIEFHNDIITTSNFGPTGFKGITLFGTVSVGTKFRPSGEIRIGGALTCKSLAPIVNYTAQCRQSCVTVLKGGSLTTTAQADHLSCPFSFNVMKDGVCTIAENGANTFNFDTKTVSSGVTTYVPCAHFVDGTLNFGLTIGLNKSAQTFAGSGRVNLKSVVGYGGQVTPLILTGGITVAPQSLHTVLSGYQASAFALQVPNAQVATIAPRADITYGIAPDTSTPTSSALDRALRLGYRATLNMPCVDPDDATVARDITFTDPIVAKPLARVVKTGAGKLTFASAENSFGTNAGVEVRSGTFAWTAPLALGALEAASGSTLAVSAANDGFAKLTVGKSVDLDGVEIVPTGTAAETLLAQGYQTVIEVPAECEITGTPVLPKNLKARFRAVDGGLALQLREQVGTLLLVQ